MSCALEFTAKVSVFFSKVFCIDQKFFDAAGFEGGKPVQVGLVTSFTKPPL